MHSCFQFASVIRVVMAPSKPVCESCEGVLKDPVSKTVYPDLNQYEGNKQTKNVKNWSKDSNVGFTLIMGDGAPRTGQPEDGISSQPTLPAECSTSGHDENGEQETEVGAKRRRNRFPGVGSLVPKRRRPGTKQ